MYSPELLYYTILLESRERDLETIHAKESSYSPCVLFKDTEQHCRGKLNCFSSQIYLPADFVCLHKVIFFSGSQVTMTVRKFRSKTVGHPEGKPHF